MDALSYLAAREQFGIKFGLRGIRALLEALGHPERDFPVLLVAGTNGKGSVAAYSDGVLQAAGLRAGLYTSPHLVRVNERVAVAGSPVSDRDLEAAIDDVRRAADRLVAQGSMDAHPTYFEAITAAALVHFRRAAVQVAVLEVGMGGRLDATNASEPIASAIVTVAMDHEAYLGSTLAAIAREKAGVLRQGRPTVLGPLPPEAREAIAAEGDRVGALLVDAYEGVSIQRRGDQVDVTTPTARHEALCPLPGAHQVDNLIVALRLLEAASRAGVPLPLEAIAPGIARTRWPGRLQRIPGAPSLLLDGAHNPAAALALAAHLVTLPPFVLVFGVMADKDVEALGRTLFPLARHLVLTRVPGTRAAAPSEIRDRVGAPAAGAELVEPVREALGRARTLATPHGLVVVAGSLYLVGAVLRVIGEE